MYKYFVLIPALLIVLCCAGNSLAQNDKEKVWLNPERYRIILLKPASADWASGYNEIILLDTETGRTWTLKSKSLVDGWVPMPRKDTPEKEP